MFAPARSGAACLALIFSAIACAQGVISTFAGTETFFPSEGKPASQARL